MLLLVLGLGLMRGGVGDAATAVDAKTSPHRGFVEQNARFYTSAAI